MRRTGFGIPHCFRIAMIGGDQEGPSSCCNGRCKLPDAFIYGSDRDFRCFEDAGMAPIACDIHTPDFIGIAKAYGCNAKRVTSLGELEIELQQSQRRSVPTLIEVMEEDFLSSTTAK